MASARAEYVEASLILPGLTVYEQRRAGERKEEGARENETWGEKAVERETDPRREQRQGAGRAPPPPARETEGAGWREGEGWVSNREKERNRTSPRITRAWCLCPEREDGPRWRGGAVVREGCGHAGTQVPEVVAGLGTASPHTGLHGTPTLLQEMDRQALCVPVGGGRMGSSWYLSHHTNGV